MNMTQRELRRWYHLSPEQKTEAEEQKILEFIKGIPDPFTAGIFKLRYIDCRSWSKVALLAGGNNTPDSVRKVAERYVIRINKEMVGE
jgi:hypothetical protein